MPAAAAPSGTAACRMPNARPMRLLDSNARAMLFVSATVGAAAHSPAANNPSMRPGKDPNHAVNPAMARHAEVSRRPSTATSRSVVWSVMRPHSKTAAAVPRLPMPSSAPVPDVSSAKVRCRIGPRAGRPCWSAETLTCAMTAATSTAAALRATGCFCISAYPGVGEPSRCAAPDLFPRKSG